MNKTILITGASGLIGRGLSQFLLQRGYTVYHLSHSMHNSNPLIKTFAWDVYNRKIDEGCIDGVDAIIHLAGEGIADKFWSKKRKELIVKSRTKSVQLLYDLLKQKKHQVKTIISASAIGYYGDRANELLIENSTPGIGFLANTCIAWENAVEQGTTLGLRVVKLRTGVVLSSNGGALPQLVKPIKWGLGAILGSGKQWISWIHLQDVLRMYHFALENLQLSGVYNMTAPNPVQNSTFTTAIAKQFRKPLWLPKIPAFILRIFLGEKSSLILNSTNVSSEKIIKAGFTFEFLTLADALNHIYGPKTAT